MTDTTVLELVSPSALLKSEPVEMVVVPGMEGNFGVLPKHAPMISTIRPGVIDIYAGGKVSERIFVAGGVAEVNPERCTILAEEAVAVSDLKADDAQARLEAADAALKAASTAHDKANAERELEIARAQISALSN
ncbi:MULTISPECIES: ATP synthase F1 subunit epsilon [Thalassospira]|jgi:F-type H+-transporting ATPase subunit epsilon|uniref:ATP synthase epsilon chain n=2 Tax=Thalassospira TaxID=168934 RepID=A0A358HW15_9PROT|nr:MULTISPECIES: ATP synthase F1 subunit epsilon [Thalassospira]MBV16413.1 ATP synthase F1 subunit epsilon [Thalassospira sp.]PKR57948.1 ATP synthase F1 subunit epsilon [Thalassospira lohafexi]RCK29842.1 ATP synthase subunit epsilon [Thalassospira lucentensis MCCC 1A00383 = DSM 14000]HBU99368.1 ATP synthase F1 subunit epsilon [Thalassospira lucentensis]HCW68410.1 ATP synthase F1 subunit epsilon [Thalassospira lucentensis]|tara:strand:- start:97234 stop:97638 length:405 start_codon:yes stop_codon:yes gene_type:complete